MNKTLFIIRYWVLILFFTFSTGFLSPYLKPSMAISADLQHKAEHAAKGKSRRTIVFSTPIPKVVPTYKSLKIIYQEAFRRMGCDFQLAYHPPEREIIEVNSGRIHGLAGRYGGFNIEKKYQNIIRVGEPIFSLQYIALSMNPSIRIDGWESVKGYKITYEQGTKYIEDNIYKYVNKTDVIVAMYFEQSFELLKSGRADLYLEIEDAQVIVKLLPEYKNIKFYSAGNLGKELLYPYVNREETDLAANLSETLRAMKADGTYDKLLKKVREND